MPCYVKVEPERVEMEDGRIVRRGGHPMFMCGPGDDEHCFSCGWFGDYLCDYPVGEGKTCDRMMCDDHKNGVAPEVDYCDVHYAEWRKFVDAGGVRKEFENIIPFAAERKRGGQPGG